jgi:hypothetical protein
MTHDASPYRTSDIYYAAYLRVSKIPLLGAEREGDRVVFLFEDQGYGMMQELKDEFYMGSAMVEPRMYAQSIRTVKGMLHRAR